MDLHDALAQISDIRQQMVRTTVFRGYRAAATGATACLAVLAALGQAVLWPEARYHAFQFVEIWVTVAAISIIIVGAGIVLRYRASQSIVHRELTLMAVEQFVPCLITGGLLTWVLCKFAFHTLWMLPGLWAILFGLGILASRRLLPSATALVGAFYLMCGLICLAVARGNTAFSPWSMGIPFGVGQTAAAAILYWTLERPNDGEVLQ